MLRENYINKDLQDIEISIHTLSDSKIDELVSEYGNLISDERKQLLCLYLKSKMNILKEILK